jgi:shikimate dehydrogenase
MTDIELSGKTKVCAIIGDPVDHTLSPPMHNAAFQALGLDYVYVPFRVTKEGLKAAVAGLKALNVRGFNITMPHKVTIIPMLDRLDPTAEKIGAVNTVVNEAGLICGYNTDGPGALQALIENGADPKGKKVVVVGAGGASRAISYVLASHGAELTILNRTLELDWAHTIARLIKDNLGAEAKVLELGKAQLKSALTDASILVNATSAGMEPDADKTPVPAEVLRSGLTVFDVIYSPVKTRLLSEAESAGCRTIGGVELLVWQGILCFEKWTGRKAPLEVMRRTALKKLEQQ